MALIQSQIRRHVIKMSFEKTQKAKDVLLVQKVSEYDQEVPQSHTADQPAVP